MQKHLKSFRKSFVDSKADMIVLTGIFNGDPKENNYGRILRVKEFDSRGTRSLGDKGKVIEILEHKDILALPADQNLMKLFTREVNTLLQKKN